MMDTPNTGSVMDPGTAAPPGGESLYERYLRTGQFPGEGASAAPATVPTALRPMPPVASTAEPALPAFPDAVAAAEKANGGKHLTPEQLQQLKDTSFTQHLPAMREAYTRKGAYSKGIEASWKAADDANFAPFAAQYNKQAAETASKGGFGESLADLGKSALGATEQGLGEAARYVGGGVAVLGDAINNNLIPGTPQSNMADAYFRATDPTVNAMTAQGKKLQEEAASRSPTAAFVGQLPGAVASLGVLPTMSAVGNERDAGGSVAQQEGILGINTAANLAGLGVGGGVAGTVGKRLLKSGLANAAIGAGQNIGSNVVDAKNNPLSLKDVGLQTVLGTALGELGHQVNARVAARAAAESGAPTAATPAGANPPVQAVDVAGKPLTDAAGNPINAPSDVQLPTVSTGAGIPEAQHAQVKEAAAAAGADRDYIQAAKAAKSPQELLQQATAVAQNAASESGADWSKMSPVQQHDAIEAVATRLHTVAPQEGLPELLAHGRQAATATPAPAIAETGQPDVQGQAPSVPGEAPQAAPQGESAAPVAEVPGQESGTPLNPELAQTLAGEAMGGEQAGSPVDNTPKDPLDQTAEQSGDLQSRQLHTAMDEALTKVRKGVRSAYPAAKLAKMTLEEKYHAYQREVASIPSATKSETVPGDVQAATAKVEAPGVNKVNDLGQPRSPGEPLNSKTPVVTTKDVHLAGGVSQDGNTIYIDQRMPKYVNVDGRRINVHEAVALHERVEWPLMKEMGAVYHDAHDAATAAENHFIRQKYDVDPIKYQDALKAAIKKAGIAGRHPNADIPSDLDSQPNVDLGDTKPLEGKVSPLSKEGVAAKKAPAPVEANPLEPTASSANADVVGQTLEGKVTPADLADVRTLVERAQNGMPEDLHARIKEMRSDDTITLEEAKTLRQAGRETPREAAGRDTEATKAVDAGKEDLLDVSRGEAPTTELGRSAEAIARAADEMPTGLKSDRARAAETIAKLRKLFPDSEPHQKATDFLAWVLGKNPALIRTINDVSKTPLTEGVNYGGRFGAVSRVLELVDRKDMTSSTAVHELMHAAESLMPPPIRDAILKAREAEISRLAAGAAPSEQGMFEYLQNGLKAKTASERALYAQGAKEELLHLRDTKAVASKRIGELYSLVNPSEYWAVHATDMLEHGFKGKGLLAQAHQWLKGFIDQIRSLFGANPNKQAIIDGLQHIMGTQESGTQRFLRDYELTKERYAGQPEGFSPVMEAERLHNFVLDGPESDGVQRTRTVLRKAREVLVASHASFDDLREGLLRNFGLATDVKHNLTLQARRMIGTAGELVQQDADKFMKPIVNAFVQFSHEVDMDPLKAMQKLGEYRIVRSEMTHQWPSEYRRNVALENGQEAIRQKILGKITRRELPSKEGEAQLTALVKQHASQPFAEWARSTKGIAHSDTGETQYDRRVRKLTEYAKNGTAEASKRFDPLYGELNKNIYQRRLQSGDVAADDPFAQAFDNNTWSTLTGYASDGKNEIDPLVTELSDRGAKLMASANAKQLNTAEGRATMAANGLLSPFQQMEAAARNVARHEFTNSVLEAHSANKKALQALAKARPEMAPTVAKHEIMNTTVESWTGTPREGYDNVRTGKHVDQLPTGGRNVVHHEGRMHYVMNFPETSDVYNGMRAIGTNWDLRDIPWVDAIASGVETLTHPLTRAVGLGEPTRYITHATNFLSQARTIANPVWTAATLLPRLMLEKPIMYALQNSRTPLDFAGHMVEAYANTFSGVFHEGTGAWLAKTIQHDTEGVRALAKANPDSMAGWVKRMNEAGASTAFTQELTMHESKNALVSAARREQSNPLVKGGRAVLRYERGLADVAENIPSVGLFRALVKKGMSDADAAALTKQAFDLQQRGTAGRAFNGYHSFFRIGATATDNLIRAFRHPEGLRPVNILGRTVHTSVDWGKVGMLVGSMSGYAFLRYYFDREMLGKDESGHYNMASIAEGNPEDLVTKGFIGYNTGTPYVYPAGLGAHQILTGPGTLMAAVMAGDISASDAAAAYGKVLGRNIPLMEPLATPEHSGLLAHLLGIGMGAVTPTVLQPAADIAHNVNDFGQSITTTHPNTQEFASDQGKTNTPEMWKDLAKSLNEHTGADFFPETLKFMSESYMGTAPTDLMRATLGQSSREAQGLPNNALSAELRLTYQGAPYYDSSHMYKVIDELTPSLQQLNHVRLQAGPKGSPEYAAAGQQWLSTNPDAQQKLVALNQIEAAKKTYQAGLKALVASKDGPERKQYVRKQLDSALRTATDAAEKTIR
jgi:hypothetical protein